MYTFRINISGQVGNFLNGVSGISIAIDSNAISGGVGLAIFSRDL